MQKLGSAIVLIVLGLLVMAFPLLGVVPAALITGFVVLIFGLGLILTGISEMEGSMAVGLTEVILGIIALVLGIGLVANPELFAIIAGLMVYIVGLILVVSGIVVVLTKDDGRLNGIVASHHWSCVHGSWKFCVQPTVLGNINRSMAFNHGNNDVIHHGLKNIIKFNRIFYSFFLNK